MDLREEVHRLRMSVDHPTDTTVAFRVDFTSSAAAAAADYLLWDDDDNSTTGSDAGSHVIVVHRPLTLLLFVFPVLTVFGNVLVCLSVVREQSLRTITNYFIVSLAVADIMVAILVMPFGVYVEVGGQCLR